MKNKEIIRSMIACVTLIFASMVQAGPILLGDFSGGESIETFDISTPAVGPFTLGNNTFSETSSGTGGPGWRILGLGSTAPILTDNAGISDITIDFSTAFSRVGLDVFIGPATYAVSFFDTDLNLLGQISGTDAGVSDSFFVGWEHLGGISRINILETSGENGRVGGLDNLRWENASVPEPSIIALFGLGLLGLGFARRRKA